MQAEHLGHPSSLCWGRHPSSLCRGNRVLERAPDRSRPHHWKSLNTGAQALNTTGVLYCVFAQDIRGNTRSKNFRRYLAEAVESAGITRALNPRLPLALASNVQIRPEEARAFHHVVTMRRLSSSATLWLPRLRALAESPFELTLALDSHAHACSSGLHEMLEAEHRRNSFDFAVNHEAAECLMPGGQPHLRGRFYRSAGAPQRMRVPCALCAPVPCSRALNES